MERSKFGANFFRLTSENFMETGVVDDYVMMYDVSTAINKTESTVTVIYDYQRLIEQKTLVLSYYIFLFDKYIVYCKRERGTV